MKILARVSVMLIALGVVLPAFGQATEAAKTGFINKLDFALTYGYRFSKLAATSSTNFGLQGGDAEVVYNLSGKYSSLGLVVDVNGETASAIRPGLDLSQITAVAGPRITSRQTRPDSFKASIYAEALFGYVHAFDSVFPGTTTTVSSANGFAAEVGGGLGVPLSKHFGWRIGDVHYIYSRLTNNNSNFQSDIRLSTGVTFHY
jgi:hypothetical protein